MSGDLGSANNTGGILEWLLSWFQPLTQAQFNLIHFYVRKTIGHFGNYAFLYLLWFRAYRGQLRWPPGRAFSLAIGCCLALALLDEGHQLMFDSRGSSLRDAALDLSGTATAALVIWIIWPHRLRPLAEK
jgi:VanZ family protein